MEPIVHFRDTWTYFGSLTLIVQRGNIRQLTQEGVLFGIAYPLKQCYQLHKHWTVFIKARKLVLPNGPATPEIYSAIAIEWTIARTISCFVIAILGPIANVNVPA